MSRSSLVTPVLVVGCLIVVISFGIRSSFGLFQIPMVEDLGWLRADFALALALQNIAWGLGAPLFGALAERLGEKVAIAIGVALYSAGLALSGVMASPLAHQVLETLIGLGIAGTGLGIILAVVGRATSERHRSMALGVVTAAGSAGQIVMPPLTQAMIAALGWQQVFLVFAVAILAVLALLPFLSAPPASRAELSERMGTVLGRAFRDPSYTLVFLGFFSCGFQIAFMTVHFPALVTELCGPIQPGGLLDRMGIGSTSALGALSLSVIGVFNIAGTLLAGWLGGIYPRKYLLAGIYTARTILCIWFILTPISPVTVLVFAAVMGMLWLSTVPLTSGLVAHLWGLRYMATLFGIVFLSHQIGGFLGVWMGGALHDRLGGYEAVWWVGIAVGAFSALIHLPVRERRPPAGLPA